MPVPKTVVSKFISKELQPMWEKMVQANPKIQSKGRTKPVLLLLHNRLHPIVARYLAENPPPPRVPITFILCEKDLQVCHLKKCQLYSSIDDDLRREKWGVNTSLDNSPPIATQVDYYGHTGLAMEKLENIKQLLHRPLVPHKQGKLLRYLDNAYQIVHESQEEVEAATNLVVDSDQPSPSHSESGVDDMEHVPASTIVSRPPTPSGKIPTKRRSENTRCRVRHSPVHETVANDSLLREAQTRGQLRNMKELLY